MGVWEVGVGVYEHGCGEVNRLGKYHNLYEYTSYCPQWCSLLRDFTAQYTALLHICVSLFISACSHLRGNVLVGWSQHDGYKLVQDPLIGSYL